MAGGEDDQPEDAPKNWLQFLVGIPFFGGWIGSFVAIGVPIVLGLMGYVLAAELFGLPKSFAASLNRDTGADRAIFLTSLILGAWIFVVQRALKVSLRMPWIPVPWLWVMAFSILVSAASQLR